MDRPIKTIGCQLTSGSLKIISIEAPDKKLMINKQIRINIILKTQRLFNAYNNLSFCFGV